jgi:hypothetical protein
VGSGGAGEPPGEERTLRQLRASCHISIEARLLVRQRGLKRLAPSKRPLEARRVRLLETYLRRSTSTLLAQRLAQKQRHGTGAKVLRPPS